MLQCVMSHLITPQRVLATLLLVATVAIVCTTVAAAAPPPNVVPEHHGGNETVPQDKRVAAMLANAAFQDVAVAEHAGYASSLNSLGCFQNPGRGGMGVHYINADLMDGTVDVTKPEALVYELDASAHITGLVA